ncbi:MAG: ArdC-like ssDNA-binding domain-containing protein [Gemmataceae bacterium]
MGRKQPTEEQKQAAAERRERFRALAKQVADMPDEARAAIVDRCGAVVTCEGRALSFVNTLLVVTQRPGASMVGGFAQWLKIGRAVRKGETGMGIWIPVMKGEKAEAAAEPAAGEEGQDGPRARFIMGTVFDVSQTDAIPVDSRRTEPHGTRSVAMAG